MHVLSGSLCSHPRNWGSAGVASWRAARGHRPVRCLPQLVARAFLRVRRRSPSPRPSVVRTQARAPASAEEWFSRDAALAWPDRGRADSRRHLASARGRRSSMHGRGQAVVWTATSDAVVRAKARDTRPRPRPLGSRFTPGRVLFNLEGPRRFDAHDRARRATGRRHRPDGHLPRGHHHGRHHPRRPLRRPPRPLERGARRVQKIEPTHACTPRNCRERRPPPPPLPPRCPSPQYMLRTV